MTVWPRNRRRKVENAWKFITILQGPRVKMHSLQSGITFKKVLLRSIWWLHRLLLVLRSPNHRSDLHFDMKMIEFWRSMCENRILVPETYIKDKIWKNWESARTGINRNQKWHEPAWTGTGMNRNRQEPEMAWTGMNRNRHEPEPAWTGRKTNRTEPNRTAAFMSFVEYLKNNNGPARDTPPPFRGY